jgi:predicted nucleotidyltransferase
MNPNMPVTPLADTMAMRLSAAQAEVILNCVRQQFGADARVMLFGSRLDDAARGGDVDLLVETATRPTLRQRALATLALEQALKLPVDIVAQQRGTSGSAFARSVRGKARVLEAAAT